MIFIILAAGKGTRLYPLTKKKPKCLVKYQGKSILDHQLENCKKMKIKKIFLVCGYKSSQIKKKNIIKIKNEKYKTTNMLYSLFKLKKLFDGKNDLIVSYGDIIYKNGVLKKLINSREQLSTIIDTDWYSYWKLRMDNPLDDAESLKLDKKYYITDIGKKVENLKNIKGQYIGLTKISKNISKKILKVWADINKKNKANKINNLYVTDFLRILIRRKFKIKAIPIKRGWLEFDELSDLKIKF